jgi:phospholipase/carboxylesterase
MRSVAPSKIPSHHATDNADKHTVTALTLQRIDGSALRFVQIGATQQPQHIMLLLHGSGSHCENLVPVAHRFAQQLPNTLFILPNAPQSYRDELSPADIAATEESRPGVDWEQIRTWVAAPVSHSGEEVSRRQQFLDSVRPPARAVNRLADLLLAKHALTDAALSIYGFSQGGMLAMYMGISRRNPCAGVVCHSGHFLGADDVLSRPRILLVVGELEMQPNQAMSVVFPATTEALKAHDIPYEQMIGEGLGHDVNEAVIDRAVAFYRDVLGMDPEPQSA